MVHALQHVAAVFQGLPVVGGDVGLALRHVDQQGVNGLALGHVELYMGGEARAAQAHQPGGPGGLGQLLLGGDGGRRGDGRVFLHFAVGFHHHGLGHLAAGEHHLGDFRHRAGHGGVHRGADVGIAVAHHGAHIHVVPFLHRGDTGRANVLLHGQNHFFRGRHGRGGDVPRVFVVGHRRAAMGAERMFWELHSDIPAFRSL